MTELGSVEYLEGFPRAVFDCASCGCRWTSHGGNIHQSLHAAPAISYYLEYRELAQKCRRLFDGNDLPGLRALLCQSPKYAFVIEALDREPLTSKLMELGSSRGYLTSYFILKGCQILGVDIAPDAVAEAKQAFGDSFAVAGSARAELGGPYDAIYHVGTIGCVADPIDLTRRLLGKLKPGGRLLFNAPNRSALFWPGQLWFDSAPPPEVVTLFPEGFFRDRFSDVAVVNETVDVQPPDASLRTAVRQWWGRKWLGPETKSLAGPEGQSWAQRDPAVEAIAQRAVAKVARLTGLASRVSPRPSEFGLMIEMVARS